MFKLLAICLLAFFLRWIGIDWDKGFHLHPDERMIIMVTERIHFFNQLNPDFFNYGSLPIYILKGVAQILETISGLPYTDYNKILQVGRYLSIVFDLGTVILSYLLAGKIFKNKKIALLSAFFYAIAFFPIQNTHFFVVDVPLAFFSTLLLYLLFNHLTDEKKVNFARILLISIILGAILATKFTGIIFLPLIFLVFLVGPHSARDKFKIAISFLLVAPVFFFIFMPYALIERQRFLNDIRDQLQMNSNPYIFPYTLQYVGTVPYLYYIKNVFLWGLGPIISLLSIAGFLTIIGQFLSSHISIAKLLNGFIAADRKNNQTMQLLNNILIFFLFYGFYFLVIGRSSVKFMRYILLLYPFFAILAAVGFSAIKNRLSFLHNKMNINKHVLQLAGYLLLTIPIMIWTLMFVGIYFQKHTRVAASEWINQNIPAGSTIAVEHWDDGLPIWGGEKYTHLELTLYDQPDDEVKWLKQNAALDQADYLIIASNRLYTPLQKLADCNKYKSCYPKTRNYYQQLFAGRLNFTKVAEFHVKPGLTVGNLQFELDDQAADESFTVYDHPKIIIFKKV